MFAFRCLNIRYLFALLGLCMFLAAGCTGDPDRQRIVGDWEIAVADNLVEQVNAESNEATSPVDNAPKMLVRFYNSGHLSTQTNMGTVRSEKQGSWKFVSYDVESQIAKIECRMLDETTEFDVVVEDKNTIRMVPPNMAGLVKKIKFVRQ